MIVASSDIPVAVPVLFLAFGVFVLVLNRRAFTDFDGELQRMAEKRSKSRLLHLLSGSDDAAVEYESLRKTRWLLPAIAVVYFVVVVLMLVKAIAG